MTNHLTDMIFYDSFHIGTFYLKLRITTFK